MSLLGDTISWDGYALSLQAGGVKRSLFLAADSKESLYCSRAIPTGLGRLWGSREYRITANSSYPATVVCAVRDFFSRIAQDLFGRDRSTLEKVIYATLIVVLGPGEALAQLLFGLFIQRAFMVAGWPSPYKAYPLSSALRNIAIGAASWVPGLIVIEVIEKGILALLRSGGVEPTQAQDAVELMNQPGIGPLISVYASIGAPILEEQIFRGSIRDYFVLQEKNTKGCWKTLKGRVNTFFRRAESVEFTWERFKTVVKTSVIFGLAHGSARQGWTNVPVIAACTLMGFIMGLLRELTGNLWASTTWHMVHNTIVTLRLHNLIPPIPFLE